MVAKQPLEQKVAVPFAEARLDAQPVEAAEGLLDLVTEAPPGRDVELTRAKLHELEGETAEAVAELQRAREISKERWSEADELRLASHQHSTR